MMSSTVTRYARKAYEKMSKFIKNQGPISHKDALLVAMYVLENEHIMKRLPKWRYVNFNARRTYTLKQMTDKLQLLRKKYGEGHFVAYCGGCDDVNFAWSYPDVESDKERAFRILDTIVMRLDILGLFRIHQKEEIDEY